MISMTRLIMFLSAIALLGACNSGQDFVVNGVITDADNGEMICLVYPIKRDGIWYEQCDTAYINGGRFHFEGEVDGVVPATLTFQNMDYVQLFIEPSEIKFSAERDALYDYSIRGLSIDNELKEYRKTFLEHDKAVYLKSHEAVRKNEEWVAAHNAGLSNADELWAECYSLILEHHEIGNRWPDIAIKYIDSHRDQAIIPHLIEELIGFDYDISAIESYISALNERQRCSPLGELMHIRHDIAKLNGGEVGSKALDATLRSADGKQIKLSECYAKGYVLLDFWASWCTPCINEIPRVRKLHEEHGDQLQIISISVDKSESDWRKAIEELHLTDWPQVIVNYPTDADSYYFAEQADMSLAYGVEQIPCFMLIDKNGIIAGRWEHLTNEAINEITSLLDVK